LSPGGKAVSFPRYRYGGARALVMLHEQELKEFAATWMEARERVASLPAPVTSQDTSLDELLHHVLSWARDYMVWTCQKLRLPDPGIRPVPVAEALPRSMPRYLDHLLDRWRLPLTDVSEEVLFHPLHTTRWSIDYPIEALLEHAIVHAMRHRLQLADMMEDHASAD